MDIRYAIRGLIKNPAFTIVAILTLALGIGANTAIFSVVNTFLIRPFPYPEPERLAALFERNLGNQEQQVGVASGNFLDWQKTVTAWERIAAYGIRIMTLSSDSSAVAPARVGVCICSQSLFATLGVAPALGRPFTPEEDRFGAARLAIISHELWQRQ